MGKTYKYCYLCNYYNQYCLDFEVKRYLLDEFLFEDLMSRVDNKKLYNAFSRMVGVNINPNNLTYAVKIYVERYVQRFNLFDISNIDVEVTEGLYYAIEEISPVSKRKKFTCWQKKPCICCDRRSLSTNLPWFAEADRTNTPWKKVRPKHTVKTKLKGMKKQYQRWLKNEIEEIYY